MTMPTCQWRDDCANTATTFESVHNGPAVAICPSCQAAEVARNQSIMDELNRLHAEAIERSGNR